MNNPLSRLKSSTFLNNFIIFLYYYLYIRMSLEKIENININDTKLFKIDDTNKSIKKIVFIITFIITFYIIFDELYKLSILIYNYNYNYNYGYSLKKLCGNDYIEFETSRFQIYNNLIKYKLNNDIYNKNNYILLILIYTIIISIIIILSFGVLFYNSFIFDDKKFETNTNIYKFLDCTCGTICTDNINTTFITKFLLFIIIIILPFTILFTILFNYDLSMNNNNFLIIYILLFFILIIFRLPFQSQFRDIKSDNKNNISSIIIYYIYISCIIFILYFYKKIFDIYNKKTSNFYDDNDGDNYNNNGDINFLDIYKRNTPIAPVNPLFAYTTAEQDILNKFVVFSPDKVNNLSQENKDIYNTNLKLYKIYMKKKDKYKSDLNDYNEKVNIINTNIKIDDPPIINLFSDIFLSFIGYKNKNNLSNYIITIGIIILIIFIIYILFNKNCKDQFKLLYNTLMIPLFNLFLIILLINTIIVFNTYINKYIIYNPLNLYKYNMNKLNSIYTNLLNNIIKNNNNPYDADIGNTVIYVILSSIITTNYLDFSHDTNIDNTLNTKIPTFPEIFYLYKKYTTDYLSSINANTIYFKTDNVINLFGYSSTAVENNFIASTSLQFKALIKTLFVSDLNTLPTILNNIYNNIVNIYCNEFIVPAFPNLLYANFKLNTYIKNNNIDLLKTDPNTLTGDDKKKAIKYQTDISKYTNLINNIIEKYKKFLLDIRNNIIDMMKAFNDFVQTNYYLSTDRNKLPPLLYNCISDDKFIINYDILENFFPSVVEKNILFLAIFSPTTKNIEIPSLYTKKTDVVYYPIYFTIFREKFNSIFTNLLSDMKIILNNNTDIIDSQQNNIIKNIINNYNNYNPNDIYNNKNLFDLYYTNLNDKDYDDKILNSENYSSQLISNSNTTSNSIFIIIFIIILTILQPIYIIE